MGLRMLIDYLFALASLAHFFVLFLLFTVKVNHLGKKLLLFSVGATVVWSAQFSQLIDPIVQPQALVKQWLTADLLWHCVTITFLVSCLQPFQSLWQLCRAKILWLSLSLPLLTIFLITLDLTDLPTLSLLMTLVALSSLLLLEILMRQAGEHGWSFKPMLMYFGALNLIQFVLYANASLVGAISAQLLLAKAVTIIVLTPVLVIAIRRLSHWGIRIFISRDVVLHSTLLSLAGAYLLLMSLLGYLVQYWFVDESEVIPVVISITSLILLFSLYLSKKVKEQIQVFISKHFFANQFDYRLAWLQLSTDLQTPAQTISATYMQALKAFCRAINYQHGELYKLDRQGHFLRVSHTTDAGTNKEVLIPLMQYATKRNWVIDTTELITKPHIYPQLSFDSKAIKNLAIQFIVPLMHAGQCWGVACLHAGDKQVINLNFEIRDYFIAVTSQVGNFLGHVENTQVVAENAQFAAFNRMSAFVLHDLKNVQSQLGLLLQNSHKHRTNPAFIDDAFATLATMEKRLDKVLRQLNDKSRLIGGEQQVIRLSRFLQRVISERCQQCLPHVSLSVEDDVSIQVEQERVANVLFHLISNAQEATPDNGSVSVQAKVVEQAVYILVIDNGCGMSNEFVQDGLFKPFVTTKGNSGMGIGVYDAKQTIEALGGQIMVQSKLGEGTTFSICLPIHSNNRHGKRYA